MAVERGAWAAGTRPPVGNTLQPVAVAVPFSPCPSLFYSPFPTFHPSLCLAPQPPPHPIPPYHPWLLLAHPRAPPYQTFVPPLTCCPPTVPTTTAPPDRRAPPKQRPTKAAHPRACPPMRGCSCAAVAVSADASSV